MVEEYAVSIENVVKRFGDFTAVNGVNLKIKKGEIFGLLGPNGAGKTTTVRLLLGLLAPSGGQVRVLGLDPVSQGQAIRTVTGVLLDEVGLYDRLTAWQNLEFPGRIARLPTAERHRKIEAVLERVDLYDRRKERVASFSKGLRQKLGLARALLNEPQLLIMDEPTSGLDPVNIRMVRQLIISLAESGGPTIFMCTHQLDEAQRICSQVGIIQHGQLAARGAPGELANPSAEKTVQIRCSKLSPTVAQTLPWPDDVRLSAAETVPNRGPDHCRLTLRVPDESAIETAVALLIGHGAGIRQVVTDQRSLEDVYIDIVQGGED